MPENASDLPPDEASFSSSHTSNFPELLRRLGVSLVVSTYQAGKLIVLRADGESINTHFRQFQSPMGVAYHAEFGRLAVGTKTEVWQFRNQAAVAEKIEPPGSHDAAFLPRSRHTTGDIRIHEIAWLGDELWAVNTRFSCLCTFDTDHSFVPRWRPKFISALAPEDRCHLNGFMPLDGRIKYVSCLGLTDTAGGWRANKKSGGCLLDVTNDEIVLSGLSMPHSPRFHQGKHWILESGYGRFSSFDPQSGTTTEVARMPGFTRGLDFAGNIAFVGLSQVRESATFGGIPLVEELEQRTCGVWAIDIRRGEVVAFLRFEGIVQEIFAVQVLPGLLYPDIVNEAGPIIDSSFVLPDDALRDVPGGLRS